MQPLFALLIIAVGSIALSKYRKKLTDLPEFIQTFLHSDLLFVLVGVAAGPTFLNVLPKNELLSLTPIVYIGLGFTGFIYGTHLEWRQIRRFPPHYHFFALYESLGTLLYVSLGIWLVTALLPVHFNHWPGMEFTPLIISGAIVCGTAPSLLFVLSHKYNLGSKPFRLIQFSSTVNDLPTILVFGLFYSIEKSISLDTPDVWHYGLGLKPLLWLAISLAMGVISGRLFKFLTTGIHKESVILSLLFGTIAFTAGMADLLGLSPIFVSMVSGITFANSSLRKEYIFGVLAHREHTVYILFLVLAGTTLEITPNMGYWLIPTLFVTRLLAKFFFGTTGLFLFRKETGRETNLFPLSSGLIPQGGVPVMLAFSFTLSFDSPFSRQLFFSVMAVIVINEILKPLSASMVKRNA
ncbi:MAG: cation:proton antiporter [Nitrospinota bacterium]